MLSIFTAAAVFVSQGSPAIAAAFRNWVRWNLVCDNRTRSLPNRQLVMAGRGKHLVSISCAWICALLVSRVSVCEFLFWHWPY